MTETISAAKGAKRSDISVTSIAEHLKKLGTFRYETPARIEKVAAAVAIVEAAARHKPDEAPDAMSHKEALHTILKLTGFHGFAMFAIARERLALADYGGTPFCIWILNRHPNDIKIRNVAMKSQRILAAQAAGGTNAASIIAEKSEAGARGLMSHGGECLLYANANGSTAAHAIAKRYGSLLCELLSDRTIALSADNSGDTVLLDAYRYHPDEVRRLLKRPDIRAIADGWASQVRDSDLKHDHSRVTLMNLRRELAATGGINPR
ncbi:MAG: hypothetical protein KGH58_01525 [Candidatus Micrarchaeota archaeon]|nr:hypothetical protein [Candidatus Micrarchaeota archaeon]